MRSSQLWSQSDDDEFGRSFAPSFGENMVLPLYIQPRCPSNPITTMFNCSRNQRMPAPTFNHPPSSTLPPAPPGFYSSTFFFFFSSPLPYPFLSPLAGEVRFAGCRTLGAVDGLLLLVVGGAMVSEASAVMERSSGCVGPAFQGSHLWCLHRPQHHARRS